LAESATLPAASGAPGAAPRRSRWADLAFTGALWLYFLLGHGFVTLPRAAWALLRPGERGARFRRLQWQFYRGFFAWARRLSPDLRVELDPSLGELRGSVVVCNHRSFLDPLLLIAALPRAVTLVRADFFRVPIFGWGLRRAGYLPAGAGGAALSLAQVQGLERHLAAGGTLFVFPEGTRSRDGHLGPFLPGAFKLARRARAEVVAVELQGTAQLYPPDRWLLRWRCGATLRARVLGRSRPDFDAADFSLKAWLQGTRSLFCEAAARRDAAGSD